MFSLFTISSWFVGTWALVLHYGFFGIVIAGCLVFAWFSPVFKKTALWIAGGIVIGLICYTVGVSNGESRIQAKWDLAEKHSVEIGKSAHTRAVRDIGRRHGRVRKQQDQYNRD